MTAVSAFKDFFGIQNLVEKLQKTCSAPLCFEYSPTTWLFTCDLITEKLISQDSCIQTFSEISQKCRKK